MGVVLTAMGHHTHSGYLKLRKRVIGGTRSETGEYTVLTCARNRCR
jgi:hypothetical protein